MNYVRAERATSCSPFNLSGPSPRWSVRSFRCAYFSGGATLGFPLRLFTGTDSDRRFLGLEALEGASSTSEGSAERARFFGAGGAVLDASEGKDEFSSNLTKRV